MSPRAGSGSGSCGASDSDLPVANREIRCPNNQEEASTPLRGDLPQALTRKPVPDRRTAHRATALRAHHPPPTTPLPVRLPQRATRRARPRPTHRPTLLSSHQPNAYLNPANSGFIPHKKCAKRDIHGRPGKAMKRRGRRMHLPAGRTPTRRRRHAPVDSNCADVVSAE